jgi:hypothetical protein
MTRLVHQGLRSGVDAASEGHRKSFFRQVFSRFRDTHKQKTEEHVKLTTGKIMSRSFVDDIKADLEKLIHGCEEQRLMQDELEREIAALHTELECHSDYSEKQGRSLRKIRMEIKEKEIALDRLRESGKEALALLYRVCTEGGRVDVTGADIFTSYTLFQHQLMDLNGNVDEAVQEVVLATVAPDLKAAAKNRDEACSAYLPLKIVAPYNEDEIIRLKNARRELEVGPVGV